MSEGERAGQGFDFAFQKQLYDIWVRTTSEMLEQIMQAPAFAAHLGRVVEQSLDIKRQMDEALEGWLKNLRFATDADMNAALAGLKVIEGNVLQGTAALRELTRRVSLFEQELASERGRTHPAEDKLAEAVATLRELMSRITVFEELASRMAPLEQQIEAQKNMFQSIEGHLAKSGAWYTYLASLVSSIQSIEGHLAKTISGVGELTGRIAALEQRLQKLSEQEGLT